MKGDIIFPKNCIEVMPWYWKLMARLMQWHFMRVGFHKEQFESVDIELSARCKRTGRFLPTPFFLDEHFRMQK